MSHTVDANGQHTDFTLDRAGRVLAVDPAGSMATIMFAYDDTGRVVSMTDDSGTTAYAYDPVGRLTSVSRGSRTVGYAYDAAGRIGSVTYPGSGETVTYAYDAAGRLQTLNDWDSRVHSYAYDDASRLTSITGPAGLVTAYAYDEVDRLTGLTYTQNGSPLLELGYTYDAAGNVATYTDDAGTTTFAYDALNRLVGADHPGTDDFTYSYDPAGNLTQLVGPAGTLARTYSDADRLLTEAASGSPLRTFNYDANGALLDDGAGTTYGYDALGRLTTVTAPGVAAAYTLDGAGNRVAATIDGVTTSYDLDLRGLTTVLSDGTRRFLPGMPSAGYEEASIWYGGVTNAQATVLGHVGSAGLVGALAHYDAWGQPLGGSAAASGPGYTGEWTDATGLVNLRFRAYDPTLQRFVGRDTFSGLAATPTTWNRFAYANANPLTYTDPTGHLGVAGQVVFTIGSFLPGPGDLYSAVTAIIGFDPVGGYTLSGWERVAAAIPFVNDIARGARGLGAAARHADDIGRAVSRTTGGAGDVARSGARAVDRGDDFVRGAPRARRGDDLVGAAPAAGPARQPASPISAASTPARALPEGVAGTFRAGQYTAKALAEDLTLYRRWGGRADELGGYWSRTNYARAGNARRYLGLPPVNTAQDVTKIRVPAGTTIYEGQAASHLGWGSPGGGNQVVFEPGFSVPPGWIEP